MLSSYAKNLMTLTPFQIITDKVRKNYTRAIVYELGQRFMNSDHRPISDDETITFVIPRRGYLDGVIADVLANLCGVKSVIAKTTKYHRIFIVNVKMAYEFENPRLKEE